MEKDGRIKSWVPKNREAAARREVEFSNWFEDEFMASNTFTPVDLSKPAKPTRLVQINLFDDHGNLLPPSPPPSSSSSIKGVKILEAHKVNYFHPSIKGVGGKILEADKENYFYLDGFNNNKNNKEEEEEEEMINDYDDRLPEKEDE